MHLPLCPVVRRQRTADDSLSGSSSDVDEYTDSSDESSFENQDESDALDTKFISSDDISDMAEEFSDEGNDASAESHSSESKQQSRRVVYYCGGSSLSTEESDSIKEFLQRVANTAYVLLETDVRVKSTPYPGRAALNVLMNWVCDRKVSEILIPDTTHICTTKDGFQLFCWVCQQFGTAILISPSLRLP